MSGRLDEARLPADNLVSIAQAVSGREWNGWSATGAIDVAARLEPAEGGPRLAATAVLGRIGFTSPAGDAMGRNLAGNVDLEALLIHKPRMNGDLVLREGEALWGTVYLDLAKDPLDLHVGGTRGGPEVYEELLLEGGSPRFGRLRIEGKARRESERWRHQGRVALRDARLGPIFRTFLRDPLAASQPDLAGLEMEGAAGVDLSFSGSGKAADLNGTLRLRSGDLHRGAEPPLLEGLNIDLPISYSFGAANPGLPAPSDAANWGRLRLEKIRLSGQELGPLEVPVILVPNRLHLGGGIDASLYGANLSLRRIRVDEPLSMGFRIRMAAELDGLDLSRIAGDNSVFEGRLAGILDPVILDRERMTAAGMFDRRPVRRPAGRRPRDGGAALQRGTGDRRRRERRPDRPRAVFRRPGRRTHHRTPLRGDKGVAGGLRPAGSVRSQDGVGTRQRGEPIGKPQGGELHLVDKHGLRVERHGDLPDGDVFPGISVREDRFRMRTEKRRLHRAGSYPPGRCRVSGEKALPHRDRRDQRQPGQPHRLFGYAGAGKTRDRRTHQLRRMHLSGREKGDSMERPAHRISFSVLAILALIAGCVTVNVYFPAAQVEKTAEKIVDEVYQEKKEPPTQGPTEKPRSSDDGGTIRGIVRLARFGPAPAFAEEATTVSNAAIRGLKEQIGRRHLELLPFYQQGQVGITRDGFLEVRGTSGLGLPQVAALKKLVDADNSARRQLYEEVAKALNLKPEQVSQVRKIFAKQWRDKALAGWAVQADDGQWGRK